MHITTGRKSMLRQYHDIRFIMLCCLSLILLSFQTIIIPCCNAFQMMPRHILSFHQHTYNTNTATTISTTDKLTILFSLKGNDNENNEIIHNNNNNRIINNGSNNTLNNSMNQSSSSKFVPVDEIERLRLQAKQLREEIVDIRIDINMTAIDKEIRRKQKIDQWLNHLLINETMTSTTTTNDDNDPEDKISSSTTTIERINDVSHVVYILINDRYSPELVFDIFERLCETTRITGRDSIQSNVLLQTLLDAVNIMDSMEREENDNKRWKSIVERTLHKRLFAKEWNIDLDTVNDQEYERNYGKLL